MIPEIESEIEVRIGSSERKSLTDVGEDSGEGEGVMVGKKIGFAAEGAQVDGRHWAGCRVFGVRKPACRERCRYCIWTDSFRA